MILRSRGRERLAQAVFVTLTTLLVVICILPIINVAAVSLSSNSAILASKVTFWPVEFNLQSYLALFGDKSMVRSLIFTAALTALSTGVSMTLSVFAAYALTKKRLMGRDFFLFLIVITMYFSGGLIPDYLLVRDLKILNTIWCLVLPGAVSAYNLIILKTFFAELPDSYEESAILEGANDVTILFKIVLPLSGPVLATIGLMYAVGRWNGFMDALFYITKSTLYPIQLKLYQIIVNSTSLDILSQEGIPASIIPPESIKAACVMFATIPILMVYPWLQKYFIKGVMIGGIKG